MGNPPLHWYMTPTYIATQNPVLHTYMCTVIPNGIYCTYMQMNIKDFTCSSSVFINNLLTLQECAGERECSETLHIFSGPAQIHWWILSTYLLQLNLHSPYLQLWAVDQANNVNFALTISLEVSIITRINRSTIYNTDCQIYDKVYKYCDKRLKIIKYYDQVICCHLLWGSFTQRTELHFLPNNNPLM